MIAARCLGWLIFGVAILMLSPIIMVIAGLDWWLYWRQGGPAANYFPPEHPDSARAWAETMERGRRIQAKEEGDL